MHSCCVLAFRGLGNTWLKGSGCFPRKTDQMLMGFHLPHPSCLTAAVKGQGKICSCAAPFLCQLNECGHCL